MIIPTINSPLVSLGLATADGNTASDTAPEPYVEYKSWTRNDSIEAFDAFGGTLFILFGLVICFFGRSLIRPLLFILGFELGASLVVVIINEANPECEVWLKIVTACCVGVVTGLICTSLYKVGLAVVGALFGMSVVRSILSTKSGGLIENQAWLISTFVVAAIVGVFLIFYFEKDILIISTSMNGSWLVFTGIDYFARTGFRFATEALAESGRRYEVTTEVWVMIASFCVLTLLGIVFQYRYDGSTVRKL